MYRPDNLFNDINVPSYMEKHETALFVCLFTLGQFSTVFQLCRQVVS